MIPEPVFLMLAGLLFIGLGWLGAFLFYRPRWRRHQRAAWDAARTFYAHRYNIHSDRL